MTTLAETTRAKLMGVSVATLCTALYKRGLRNQLDSHFKCDTEVGGEGFDRGLVVEAFSRRRVEVPDNIVDVGIGVLREGGLAGELAAEPAIRVFDRAALPWTMRVAEIGAEVQGGRSIIGLYPATNPKTLEDFAAWRKANGR